MTQSVLILLHPGFEEMEACAPIDILRRGGLEVVTASTANDTRVTGRNGITFVADTTLDAVADRDFACVVIPGGPGTFKELRPDPRVRQLAARQAGSGRLLGAICAAPLVLHDAGVLEGRRYTAHFSTAEELNNLRNESVVEDGNLITSRGAGTATAFSLALLRRLKGEDTATEVAAAICLAEPQ